MTKEPRYPSFPAWPQSCSRRGAPRGAAALTNAPSRSPVLLSLAQSNFNGKFEGVLGSDVGFSACQSCQLLPGSWECSAHTPPGHGVCQCARQGAGLRSGIVLGSSEQNQTQSPRTERWRPKLSLLEKQSWKKTLPPPAWLAAQPVWVSCLWAPKGACSKALNVSGF